MANQSVVTILIQARDAASRVFSSIGASVTKLKGAFFSMQAQLAVASATLIGGGLVAFLIHVNREYGKLLTQLQTFQGSSVGARAVFDELSDFAAKTPFQIGELVEAFIKLRSAGINPSMETLRLFGDHTAAFGGRIVDFADAVRAATTGEMERLKQFGVVARLQGETLQVSFNGVTKSIGRDAASIVKYLEDLSRVNFAGGMERQSKTLDGAISNLQDSIETLARKIGDSGLTDMLVDLVTSITDFTTALGKNDGPMRSWIGFIKDSFTVAADSFKVLSAWMDVAQARSERLATAVKYWAPGVRSNEEQEELRKQKDAAKAALDAAEARLSTALDKRSADINNRAINFAVNKQGSAKQRRIKALEDLVDQGGAMTPAQAQEYLALTKPEGGMVKQTTASSTNTAPPKKEKTKKEKTEIQTQIESALSLGDEAVRASELNVGKQLDQLQRMQEAQALLNMLLGKQNLTMEQRLDLEKQRAEIVEQMNKKFPKPSDGSAELMAGVGASIANTAQNMENGAKADIDATFKNGLPAQNTLDAISKAMKAAVGEGQTLNQIIADMTTNTFQAFGSAVQDAFSALVQGSASAGQAFASAMLGALGSVAAGFGQFFMARATGELAAGIGALSNPLTASTAAGHFASAAKWSAGAFAMFAIAGSLSGAASVAGGSGRGTSATRDTNALKDQKGDAEIIIEGNLLDMNDPRTEASFARAIESLSGRRVTITTRRK